LKASRGYSAGAWGVGAWALVDSEGKKKKKKKKKANMADGGRARAAPLSDMVRRLQATATRRAVMGYTTDFDVFFGWFRAGELEAVCGVAMETLRTVWEKYAGKNTPLCKV
jgi:hypothetical protein